MRTASIAATLLGFGASTYAQSVSASQDGITYAFSIPETTSSSGSGDVYIQISGPTSFGYIGLGSGSRMSGSNMFIIYQNAAGTNVTLSPRTASGQSQPQFDSSAQAVLIEGSGVSNGMMTANIRCSDCASKFDITSSSASLIYAARSGTLQDDSQEATIQQHSSTYGSLSLDMTQGVNTANSNPFVSGTGETTTPTTGGGGGVQSCVPIAQVSGAQSATSATSGASATGGYPWNGGSRPTGRPSWTYDDGDDNDNYYNGNSKRQTAPSACPSGYVLSGSTSSGNNGNNGASFSSGGADADRERTMLMAHGIMAGLAFAVLFPFGAISIRLLSFPGLVWFHAAFQVFAYLLYIAAFGLGIYLATPPRGDYLREAHPIIGIVLFIMLFAMPILGQWHHSNFKKFQRRTLPSYMHLWLGRSIITLGIINGGLGFQLANNTDYGHIVYAVVAAIMYLVYLVAVIIGERRRAQNFRGAPPKYDEVLLDHQTPPGSSAPRHREFYGGQK